MLKIKNLDKTYANGVHALDNVSLEISNGMFGLLGPNGAGKSTLMRTIATLQPADGGHIEFNGIDVLQQPDRIRRILGYLPQDFGVYPRISAEAMLDHMAVLKGIVNTKERKELVAFLLAQTNLDHVKKKALTGFSGGMRQRFGIAQALIGDPKLMIVDEPTAGLDPEERNRFHNLLAEIIFSTRIRKHEYLLGRFIGAFAVAYLAFSSVAWGSMVGSFMPWPTIPISRLDFMSSACSCTRA
jgi:ABC-2 type transport system ATP-binding protein